MDPIRIPLSNGEAYLEVNEENYLSLRKAYRKAQSSKYINFRWRGMDLVKSFAKYMLEYMEMSPLITEAVKAEDDPEEDE